MRLQHWGVLLLWLLACHSSVARRAQSRARVTTRDKVIKKLKQTPEQGEISETVAELDESILRGRSQKTGKRSKKKDRLVAGDLNDAIRSGSFNKYLTADPVWSAQLAVSSLACLVMAGSTMQKTENLVSAKRLVVAILLARHALALTAEVRRILTEAADGDVDRRRMKQLARGLAASPGAPTSLLYTISLLVYPGFVTPSLAPLILRELFTFAVFGLDILRLLRGQSTSAESVLSSVGESVSKDEENWVAGPQRRLPPSLSSVSLLFEGTVGVCLLLDALRKGISPGWPRRLAGLILYANFLAARVSHIEGLRASISVRDVGGALSALASPIFSDVEPGLAQVTSAGGEGLPALKGGKGLRKLLAILGFVDDLDGDDAAAADGDEDEEEADEADE